MRRIGRRARVLGIVVPIVGAILLAGASRGAEPPPAPSATPGLRLSSKPLPGCCCYPIADRPGEWGCDWGLQEEKCRAVGIFLKLPHRWSAGRCPQPSPAPE